MNLKLKKVLSLVIGLALFTAPVSASCFAGPREFKQIAEPALRKYYELFRTEKPHKEYTELLFPNDAIRKSFIDLYNKMIRDCGLKAPSKNCDSTLYIHNLKTAGYNFYMWKTYPSFDYEDFLNALASFNGRYLITLLEEDQLVFPSDNCRTRFFEIYSKVAKRNMAQVKVRVSGISLVGLYSDFGKYACLSDGLTMDDYFFLFCLGQFNGLDLNFNHNLFSSYLCGVSSKE